MFEYILNIAKFKTWKNTRTHSQLLWIYGGTGLGKTPLTLFLINEFETKPEQTENFITLYYFCDSKTHTSNHAVSLLRGLMVLLLRARPELLDVLLSDYDIQKDSLFSQSPSSLEALWRNFVNMARDPRAGRVYCIIDGIDQCGEESLEHLLDIIKEFYEDEEEQYRLRQTQNTNPATQQQQGAGLQMLLISREAPKCISEALDKFPRIPLKKDVKRAINKTTKLASIARDVLRQEHARAATTTAVSTPAAPSQPSSSVSFNAAVSVPPITPASSISVNPTPVLCESLPSIFMASTPEVLAGNVAPSSSADTTHSDPVELADSTLPEISVPAQTEYVFDKPVAEDETYLEEDIEEEENQSLAIYIKERIAVLATERAYPEAVCSSLSIGLENRGDGTFLWVDLAIGEIKRYQPQDAEQVLAQLPEDPNEIYCSTLQSIPQNLVRLTIAILRWVLAARRPLFVQELGAALGLLNYQSFDTRALTLQGIAACGSMLTVEEDDTVHVTHNSVKDLLTGERSPLRTNASLSHFYVSLENTDGEIASLCIQYLELGCLTNGAVLPTDGQEKYFKHVAQYPLFPYAVEFWPSHLREATRPQINLSSPFFIKTSKIRKNWWLTYWPATTGKWSLLAPRNFSLLHMASYLNLPYLAQQLAQRGELRQYLDDRDNHGSSPLSYAAELGHLDMFVLLLQQGAKLDAVNETVFELAARKGQAQIVETLLKRGYPVNTPARDVGTLESLTQATKYISGVFNEGIMTDRDQWKLMTRDTGQGSTVLHNAALFGHVSVVELLLKWNGNVRATTTKNWTPLHASSWTGQIECVKLLLDKGADASAVTDFGWIPYHCAASRGKTAVVELYIKLGLPVDAMTVKQKTALHLASWGGNAATVRTLVSCGAAINFQSYKGETPLHLAVRNLKPQIVELLLSFGANKYIINKDGLPVSDILRNFQGGGTADQKEMLRILDTFGMPGYVSFEAIILSERLLLKNDY
ncbi:NACHT and ankyrin domain-containing protein [Hyaloscypha finlandica]|nr:NACHT and ankyrin domain-containing protein [Hyaloscypha finlandica]